MPQTVRLVCEIITINSMNEYPIYPLYPQGPLIDVNVMVVIVGGKYQGKMGKVVKVEGNFARVKMSVSTPERWMKLELLRVYRSA